MEHTYWIGLNPIEINDIRFINQMQKEGIKGLIPIFETEENARKLCTDCIKITSNNNI